MKVIRGLGAANYAPQTTATMGTFDGLHLGHQRIVQELIQQASARSASRTLVITFDPHPQTVLRRNETSVEILTTIEERLELFEKLGVDEVLVIEFTKEFAATSYDEFFESVLVKQLSVTSLVVGFDHAFGKNRQGDVDHVKRLAPQFGVEVTVVPQLVVGDTAISSTKIRKSLQRGDVHEAAEMLGRHYGVSGIVIEGEKIGRTLNFPTANLRTPQDKLIPMSGVYAGVAITEGLPFPAAISIGSRPTVDDSGKVIVEAHLIGFDETIYGQQLELHFLQFLRAQEKYANLEELQVAISADVARVREIAEAALPP